MRATECEKCGLYVIVTSKIKDYNDNKIKCVCSACALYVRARNMDKIINERGELNGKLL